MLIYCYLRVAAAPPWSSPCAPSCPKWMCRGRAGKRWTWHSANWLAHPSTASSPISRPAYLGNPRSNALARQYCSDFNQVPSIGDRGASLDCGLNLISQSASTFSTAPSAPSALWRFPRGSGRRLRQIARCLEGEGPRLQSTEFRICRTSPYICRRSCPVRDAASYAPWWCRALTYRRDPWPQLLIYFRWLSIADCVRMIWVRVRWSSSGEASHEYHRLPSSPASTRCPGCDQLM